MPRERRREARRGRAVNGDQRPVERGGDVHQAGVVADQAARTGDRSRLRDGALVQDMDVIIDAARRGVFEVWVTHMFVLNDLVGVNTASGEGLILQADGSIRAIRLLASSGNPRLDEAAKNSVRRAAPFAPFDARMRNLSELRIIRTWRFAAQQDQLDVRAR